MVTDISTLPGHLQNLLSNIQEVQHLLTLHTILTGPKPGRRQADIEVLNKSAVVLIVACWEAYVEDLATLAFDTLLGAAKQPTTFPDKVLAAASRELRSDHDARKLWQIAGEGWRQVLEAHRQIVLEEQVSSLNTPRPAQVDALFENLIGLRALSSYWKWKGTSVAAAKERLNALVTLRGDIAHRVSAAKYVKKREVFGGANLVQALAAISSNRVRSFVATRTGSYPWGTVRYRKTG